MQSVKRETKNFERIVSTEFRRIGPSTLLAVGLWYWLGAVLGLGVALGTVVAGLIAPVRAGIFLAAILAAAAGYGPAIELALGVAALVAGAEAGVPGEEGTSSPPWVKSLHGVCQSPSPSLYDASSVLPTTSTGSPT